VLIFIPKVGYKKNF